MKQGGLLRLRAVRDTFRDGGQYRVGDTCLVTPAEAERLLAWGAFELTDQARAMLYGHDPWGRATR